MKGNEIETYHLGLGLGSIHILQEPKKFACLEKKRETSNFMCASIFIKMRIIDQIKQIESSTSYKSKQIRVNCQRELVQRNSLLV